MPPANYVPPKRFCSIWLMPSPRLYHFSEEPDISVFEPRHVPEERRMGREGLDDPLVWALDDSRAPLYYFPRECPRIFLWLLPTTTDAPGSDA